MLGRILLILPLFFVFASTVVNYIEPPLCMCELFWTRDGTSESVSYRIDLFQNINQTLVKEDEDCQTFSGKCLQHCEDRINELYTAISLPSDFRFKLGKMLCQKIGVGVSRIAPRNIFLRPKVFGCKAFDSFAMGELCCYSCENSGIWEVSYNPGCSSENLLGGNCDI